MGKMALSLFSWFSDWSDWSDWSEVLLAFLVLGPSFSLLPRPIE